MALLQKRPIVFRSLLIVATPTKRKTRQTWQTRLVNMEKRTITPSLPHWRPMSAARCTAVWVWRTRPVNHDKKDSCIWKKTCWKWQTRLVNMKRGLWTPPLHWREVSAARCMSIWVWRTGPIKHGKSDHSSMSVALHGSLWAWSNMPFLLLCSNVC